MTKRLQTILNHLICCKRFADVGCDHGYCSEYMLKNGLCERAILSDVSKGSLAKAETLLAPYIRQGRAISVLGDGFFGVPKTADEVFRNVTNGCAKNKSYSIVLQHDLKSFSVKAVEDIIIWGLANGFTFEKLTESSPGSHHPVNN